MIGQFIYLKLLNTHSLLAKLGLLGTVSFLLEGFFVTIGGLGATTAGLGRVAAGTAFFTTGLVH
jgi:hypothetical protein